MPCSDADMGPLIPTVRRATDHPRRPNTIARDHSETHKVQNGRRGRIASCDAPRQCPERCEAPRAGRADWNNSSQSLGEPGYNRTRRRVLHMPRANSPQEKVAIIWRICEASYLLLHNRERKILDLRRPSYALPSQEKTRRNRDIISMVRLRAPRQRVLFQAGDVPNKPGNGANAFE